MKPAMSSDVESRLSRSRLLLGDPTMQALATARVIIFGVGGVGSWAAEALVRSGLMHITIVDDDKVAPSNINRQLPARVDTIGLPKVEALKEHLLLVNPDAVITAVTDRYTPETAARFALEDFDYVIDAIDSVSDKVSLILHVTSLRHPKLFSSMGAALKTDPTQVEVADFWNVSGCPLARALRQRFKRGGILPRRKFRCVFSPEQPSSPHHRSGGEPNGSLLQVTGTFGFTLASMVISSISSAVNKAT